MAGKSRSELAERARGGLQLFQILLQHKTLLFQMHAGVRGRALRSNPDRAGILCKVSSPFGENVTLLHVSKKCIQSGCNARDTHGSPSHDSCFVLLLDEIIVSSIETISPHAYAQTGADTRGPVDAKTLKVAPPVVAALINGRWFQRGRTWKPLL